ncbi:Translation initiation factor IF-2, partial [Frankliniella fusca]
MLVKYLRRSHSPTPAAPAAPSPAARAAAPTPAAPATFAAAPTPAAAPAAAPAAPAAPAAAAQYSSCMPPGLSGWPGRAALGHALA